MIEYTKKLLKTVESQCWWRFCFPKELNVTYRVLPQFVDRCVYTICFYIKKRHFCVGIYHKVGDEPDYKFAAKQFFRAYRRTKWRIANEKC